MATTVETQVGASLGSLDALDQVSDESRDEYRRLIFDAEAEQLPSKEAVLSILAGVGRSVEDLRRDVARLRSRRLAALARQRCLEELEPARREAVRRFNELHAELARIREEHALAERAAEDALRPVRAELAKLTDEHGRLWSTSNSTLAITADPSINERLALLHKTFLRTQHEIARASDTLASLPRSESLAKELPGQISTLVASQSKFPDAKVNEQIVVKRKELVAAEQTIKAAPLARRELAAARERLAEVHATIREVAAEKLDWRRFDFPV